VPARFELAAQPITLAVQGHADCRRVSLENADGDKTLLSERCKKGAGEIYGISPGRYRACSDSDCVAIEIAAEPARQAITIP